MRRTLMLSVVLPLAMGFLGTLLAQTLALPALVDAQESRVRVEQVTVVGQDSAERVRLSTGPGAVASLAVLGMDGTPRATVATGGPAQGGGVQPNAAGFNLSAHDGTPLGRLGTAGSGAQWEPGSVLQLNDSQGRVRVRLAVGADGTPSIQMLDANGNATWTAR